MTNRSLPDFMMLSRFFQSAELSELEEALTFDGDTRNQTFSGPKLHLLPRSQLDQRDQGASNT